jgi:glycosyltransferase involved in cell wall biosynthesis
MDEISMNVFVVIVLYKMSLEESSSYLSMERIMSFSNHKIRCQCMIYDNSPKIKSDTDGNFSNNPLINYYFHDPENGGLCAAYNHALATAITNGFDWLLLMDQDTVLPANFFDVLSVAVNNAKLDERIVAIVPKVVSNHRMVSPCKVKFAGRLTPLGLQYQGICEQPATAINSGSLLRTTFLKNLGQFPSDFKLDFLDHWIFHTIYKLNKRVYVQQALLQHELSVSDFDRFVTEERYANILAAEWLFYKRCKSLLERCVYVFRLSFRILYRSAKVQNKKLGIVLIKHFAHVIKKFR